MVDASKPSVGVLIDLDLAAQIRDGDRELEVKASRVGTLPFLPIDLLVEPFPPRHYYRHDLESFFYVLVWICVHYRRGEPSKLDFFRWWYTGNWAGMEEGKLGFLTNVKRFLPLELGELRSLIESIGGMFDQGYEQRTVMSRLPDTAFDEETLGGNVTFDRIMSFFNE